MTETDFQVGDRVRITATGTVSYRYPEGERTIYVALDDYDIDTEERAVVIGHSSVLDGQVELIDRAYEVFPVGAVVRNKEFHDYVYTILEHGWYDHHHDKATPEDDDDYPFTSQFYERLA